MSDIKPKTKIFVDKQRRPHCLTGPFCIWPTDGSKLYAVHGVYVDGWIIEEKHKITVEKIEAENNAEIRRVMIDLYGPEKYLMDSKFEVLDEDLDQFARPRRLLRKIVTSDYIIMRVEVTNSSPELDSSFKKYYLPVDPELRPLLPRDKFGALSQEETNKLLDKMNSITREEQIEQGYLGKKQKLTCHNAVASTFRRYGKEYGLDGQIRQGDVFIEFKDGTNKRKFRES